MRPAPGLPSAPPSVGFLALRLHTGRVHRAHRPGCLEETVYFAVRWHGGWEPVFYANLVLSWALPFFLLLPRQAKRNEKHLLLVAAILLLGRWLDLYLMVMPSNHPEFDGLKVWDVAAFVGLAGLFLAATTRAVTGAPVLPQHDPYLGESLNHHT